MATWTAIARHIGESVVETIYPRRCAGCGRRGMWVCADCDRRLRRFQPPWCERCGTPPAILACRCAELSPSLTCVRSFGLDEEWLKTAIRSFKYGGESSRATHLAEALVPVLATLPPFDALAAVPLHPSRERRRGYNQAQLLVSAIGRLSSYPIEQPLCRVRATPQQVGLNADQRRANVADAFAIAPDVVISGKRFVLVDDVLTTGSTLGQCADTLVSGGAVAVSAVTLAREP